MKQGQMKTDESKTAMLLFFFVFFQATVRKHCGFVVAAESSHTAGVSSAKLKCGMREQRKKCKTDLHLRTVRRDHPREPQRRYDSQLASLLPFFPTQRKLLPLRLFTFDSPLVYAAAAAAAASFLCFFKVTLLSPLARAYVCVRARMRVCACVSFLNGDSWLCQQRGEGGTLRDSATEVAL